MANILPRHIWISAIVFILVMVSGISILGILNDENSAFLSGNTKYTQFNESFNKLNEVSEEVGDMQSSISGAETDYGLFGVLNSLIATSWNTLTNAFASLSFLTGIWQGVTYVFGVPLWVTSLITLLVTVVVVFAIWSAIFQREL